TPDGSKVIVAGTDSGAIGGTAGNWHVVAWTTSSGGRLWSQTVTVGVAPGTDPRGFVVSPDSSTVYVTGSTHGTFDAYTTVAYNTTTGALRWKRVYDGPGNNDPTAIDISPDGSKVFVTGANLKTPTGSDTDIATIAYNAATGATIWTKLWGGPGSD